MRDFILINVLLSFVASAHAAALPPVTCPASDTLPEVVYLTHIHDELIISLKLCSESGYGFRSYVPVKIQISKNNVTQTIEVDRSPDGPDAIQHDKLNQTLSFEDINFDGHKDIKMLRSYGATGNAGYLYWLFTPATSNFDSEPNAALADLSNPEPNLKTKEVCSSSKAGYLHSVGACYIWKESDLVKIREITQYFDQDKQRYMIKTSYFSNGVLEKEVTGEIPCSESTPCK